MTNNGLTPSQYVRELNTALRSHSKFKRGMRFFLEPEGSTDTSAIGVGWSKMDSSIAIAFQVQRKVDARLNLLVE
jgi:hypothetical protein